MFDPSANFPRRYISPTAESDNEGALVLPTIHGEARIAGSKPRVIRELYFCGHYLVMGQQTQILFGSFRLDLTKECLWQDDQTMPLRPKAFAVLKFLVERHGTLVTKRELLEGVWPDTFVSDAVLKDVIGQLREVLGDEAKSPRFIETKHRRGYSFIAPLSHPPTVSEAVHPSESEGAIARFSSYLQGPAQQQSPNGVLGREDALNQMRGWLDVALNTESQIIFVTGEAGIGKTTLVEAFFETLPESSDVWIARGQCMEQYGAGEPYLPVLDAFAGLIQEKGREVILDLLTQHAPSWLSQMPSLTYLNPGDPLLHQGGGITRERMMREIGEAFDFLTAKHPLILVLEDLHWSDYSTLDLVSYLARRRDASRLMLIGTYRPVEVILREHPLKAVKQELQLHKLCQELPLEYLNQETIGQFLSLRFPSHRFPEGLATLLYQRTEGNPLFMINVLEYLVNEEVIVFRDDVWDLVVDLEEVELGVPENVRNLIEKHVERLTPEEQRVLEGASVVGMDCSAVAISAGLGEDVLRIEEVCDGLARSNHFLLPAYLAELPDGTITPRYHFIHALYLDVLYKRIASTRRSRIHGRIGNSGEAIYGDRVNEIAAELAVHFDQARDSVRAVKYLQMAADNALRRSAKHEAKTLARRALELIQTLPDTPERSQQEQTLRDLHQNLSS